MNEYEVEKRVKAARTLNRIESVFSWAYRWRGGVVIPEADGRAVKAWCAKCGWREVEYEGGERLSLNICAKCAKEKTASQY
jgi:hypothetical protein